MPDDDVKQTVPDGDAGAAPTPAVTAVPAGEPAQPAAAPAPTKLEDALGAVVSPPAPSTAPVGSVDPLETLEFTNAAGSPDHATIAQLVDHWVKTPKIDANRMELLQTFEKAMAGDSGAFQKLTEIQAQSPAASAAAAIPGVPAVGGDDLQKLQANFTQLQQTVAAQTPMLAQIETAQRTSTVRGLLDKCKTDLPYSHKHPQGPQMVLERIQAIEQIAAANNVNLRGHPNQQAILMEAFRDVERTLEGHAKVFNGWAPEATGAQPAPGAPGTEVVDDQQSATPGHLSAELQMLNGQIVDKRGVPVQPNGQPGVMPAGVPDVTGTGAAVGMAPAANQGPMTLDQLRADLKASARDIQQRAGL